jgi:murein DD-endopeptidase MepM/ murein hydrolase activator NlpD
MRCPAFLLLMTAAAPGWAQDHVAGSAAAQAPPPVRLGDSGDYRTRMLAWSDTGRSNEISAVSAPLPMMHQTSSFGTRKDPMRGSLRFHAGMDLRGIAGAPVSASADGVVASTGRGGGYGNMVEIDHGAGISTRYAHLSSIVVFRGDRVSRGEVIGAVGSTGRSTGSHLHYEVRVKGLPADPELFLSSTMVATMAPPLPPPAARSGWSADIGQHLPISQIK